MHGVLFDGGWPDAPHRVLRNGTVGAWEAADRPPRGRRPGESNHVGARADGTPVCRYEDVIPTPDVDGDAEDLALYAGQSAGLVRDTRPAAEIIDCLVRDASDVLRQAVS